jgi:hypothetical protein
VLSDLKSKFTFTGTSLVDGHLLYNYTYNGKLIQLAKWGEEWNQDAYHYSLITYQPDEEMQYILLDLLNTYRMTLSQVEVALDFYPEDPRDLYDLRMILTDGIVLRYSRPGCYLRYVGNGYTEYIGKGGNVRKGTKGIRMYRKQHDGRQSVRMELVLLRPFIKRHSISLPVNAYDFQLFDFVDYRESLDIDRLLKLLCKRQAKANPIKRTADVEMVRSLERQGLLDWIESQITGYGNRPVCDQIGRFKEHLKNDNLANRVNEFFRKSGKKAMLMADLQDGFVRREYPGPLGEARPWPKRGKGMCIPNG